MKSVVAQIWPTVTAGETIRLFRSHRIDYQDGGQLRDFVHVHDAAKVAAWLLTVPQVSGVYNLGTGVARSFRDLALATFAAAERKPSIAYIDTPEVIRDKYQYFTEARMDRLRAAGYEKLMTPLEDGIGDYVRSYLSQSDPYR